MIDLKEFLKNKELPEFLTNSSDLKRLKTAQKIFPQIGLSNFKEELIVSLDTINIEPVKEVLVDVKKLLVKMYNFFSDRIHMMRDLGVYTFNRTYTNNVSTLDTKYRDILIVTLNVIDDIRYGINTIKFVGDDGKFNLKLHKNITIDNDIIFREGESIFKVYNKLAVIAKEYFFDVTELDQLESFKNFSSMNMSNKYTVAFSSDGLEGAWDLVTMSMRGIKSCQSWDGGYKDCLIGSVVDPFVGIIYLEGESKTKFGSKMIRRSIVRFVIDIVTKKPYLAIDRMYPVYDANIGNIFKQALTAKVGNKMEVCLLPDYIRAQKSYIPQSPIHGALKAKIRSYRDTKFPYKYDLMLLKNKHISNACKRGNNKFIRSISNSIQKNHFYLKESSFTNRYFYLKIFRNIGNNLTKSVTDENLNATDRFKRLGFLFLNKDKIFKEFKKEISILNNKRSMNISSSKKLFNNFEKEISKDLKIQLKKIMIPSSKPKRS